MHLVSIAAVCVVLAGSVPALAQEAGRHAPDGGTREQMESVYITPAPNAPFSAIVRTEWTHILPDGSKSTVFNHRTVARDGSGRVFQERRYLSPKGNTEETRVSVLQFDDPNRHERFLCYPDRRICEAVPLFVFPAAANVPAGPLPGGLGTLQREDLGHKLLEGMDTVGTREVTTLNAGVFGNQKPQPLVKEFWYAPQLEINLVTRRFDPRVASVQNLDVTDVQRGEPDPRMFDLPSGYEIEHTRFSETRPTLPGAASTSPGSPSGKGAPPSGAPR